MWFFILQRISFEFLLHIILFPVWWYGRGAALAGRAAFGFFQSGNNTLAPMLWLRNLFVPMYGQADWQGLIVSVFIRLVNVVGRFLALLAWILVAFGIWAAWLAAPIVLFGLLFASRA